MTVGGNKLKSLRKFYRNLTTSRRLLHTFPQTTGEVKSACISERLLRHCVRSHYSSISYLFVYLYICLTPY